VICSLYARGRDLRKAVTVRILGLAGLGSEFLLSDGGVAAKNAKAAKSKRDGGARSSLHANFPLEAR